MTSDLLLKTLDQAREGVLVLHRNGTIRYVNYQSSVIFDEPPDKLESQNFITLFSRSNAVKIKHALNKLKTQSEFVIPYIVINKPDKEIVLEIVLRRITENSGEWIIVYLYPASPEPIIAGQLDFVYKLIAIANKSMTMPVFLKLYVNEIKKFCRCQAVAIRLLKDDLTIPYEYYSGFPQSFYQKESPLSIIKDQCMCINVIRGDCDPELPFYTDYGSFFMNATTCFLKTVSEEEKGATRNICNQYGYESVALIPIKVNNKIIGLIHIADTRENRLPLELVQVLELISMHMGAAIENIIIREKVQFQKQQLENRVKERTRDLTRKNELLNKEIKERKLILKQLDIQQKYLHHLAQTVPGALFQFITRNDGTKSFPFLQGQLIRDLQIETTDAARDANTIFQCITEPNLQEISSQFGAKHVKGATNTLHLQFQKNKKEISRWLRLDAVLTSCTNLEKHWTGIVTDVTELHQKEMELLHSEKQLRKAQELALIGNWEWNVQTGKVTWSEQIYKILDVETRDPYQVFSQTRIHPDDKDLWDRAMYNIRNYYEPFQLDFRIIKTDGVICWLHNESEKVTDDFGNVLSVTGIIQDITKLKQNEEKLLSSEKKYHKLFSEMKFGCTLQQIILDEKGVPVDYVTLDMNPASEHLLGIKKEDVLGKPIGSMLPPEEFKKWLNIFSTVALTGKSVAYEQYSEHNDKFFEGSVYCPVPGQFAVNFEDVTERVKINRTLDYTKELYRNILNNISDAVFVTDAAGLFTFVCQNVDEIFGYTMTEVEELHNIKFLFPENLNFTRLINEEQEQKNIEFTIYDKYRREHTILVNIKHVQIGAGRLLFTCREVSELKKTHTALQQSEERYRALVNASPNSVLVFQNGQYVFCNPAGAKLLGYNDPQEIIGKSVTDGIDNSSLEILQQRIKNLENGDSNPLAEIYYNGADGSQKVIESLSVPITYNNEPAFLAIGRDVTLRNKLERELELQRKRIYEIFEQLPGYVCLFNSEFGIVFANKVFMNLFGNYENKKCYQIFCKSIAPCDNCSVKTVFKTKENLEREWQSPGGKYYLVANSFYPAGEWSEDYVLEFGIDITLRKEADIRLRQSEEQLRRIVEQTPVMMHFVDFEMRILSVSDHWLKTMGYTRDEVLGRKWVEFINPEWQDVVINIDLPNLLKSGCNYDIPLQYITKRRTILDILFSAIVIYNEKKQPLNLLAVSIDITEKKRAEQLLRESEQKFRNLAELSPMGIMIVQKKSIMYANKTTAQLLDLSRDDLNSSSFDYVEKLVLPEVFKKSTRLIRKNNDNTDLIIDNFEFKIITGNNTERWLKILSTAIPYKNKPAMMYCIIDTSEQKNAELLLFNSRKELRDLYLNSQIIVESERKRIAREIHDELGQSLTALKIDMFSIKKRMPGNDDYLNDKCNDMIALVDKTIDSVKTISQALRPGLLDNIGLASAIEWQALEYEKRTGIKFNFRISHELVPVQSDKATALFRIFQETITNVIRHANATRVDIQYSVKNNVLNLIIRDNGKGITKQEIADSTSLGLLGMRERVLPYNGNVEIYGKSKYGTIVTITIPL
ncbi:MAG TPA: PAS domain S-box protein [bacterium]|nr:PAS domain S-box protein [bacterium]HPN43953.1 PAS domain S-box protein [bacterium]